MPTRRAGRDEYAGPAPSYLESAGDQPPGRPRGDAMAITLNPYISLNDGKAREALDFYRSVLGGEATTTTFGEGGAQGMAAGEESKVMHGQLVVPGGLVLMVSDAPESMREPETSNISVSLSGGAEDDATLRGYFAGLSEGGTPIVALEAAPWGDVFGMVVDRYGITWMVNIQAAA